MGDAEDLASSMANSILAVLSENKEALDAVCAAAEAADQTDLTCAIITGILKFASKRPLHPRKIKEGLDCDASSCPQHFSSSEFSTDDGFSSDNGDQGIQSTDISSITGTGNFSEDEPSLKENIDRIPAPFREFSEDFQPQIECEQKHEQGDEFSQKLEPAVLQGFDPKSGTSTGVSQTVVNCTERRTISGPYDEFSQDSDVGFVKQKLEIWGLSGHVNGFPNDIIATDVPAVASLRDYFSQDSDVDTDVVNSADRRTINDAFSQDSGVGESQGHVNGFPNDVIATDIPPVDSLHDDYFSQDSDVDKLTSAFEEFSQEEE